MDVYKIAMLGICGALLARFFSGVREEYALLIGLAVSIMVMLLAVGRVQQLAALIQNMEEQVGLDPAYVKLLVKMLAVSYVSQFAAGICRDAGNSAIAGQIEIYAKLMLAAMCIPVVLALIEVISAFLKV